jgi:hypothetical protein
VTGHALDGNGRRRSSAIGPRRPVRNNLSDQLS